MKLAKHPTKKIVVFEEEDHIYYVQNEKNRIFTSGTQFLHKFAEPFDREGISKRYAEKHNLDQQEVLKSWEEKGRISRENGTKVHDFMEQLFYKNPIEFDEQNEEVYQKQMVGRALWLELLDKYQPIEAEKVVAHLDAGIAGMVDLIAKDRYEDVIWILDYKTNKKIDYENPFQIFKKPIHHLQKCSFNEYTLQMNLYRWIMEQEGYFPKDTKFKQAIIHIRADGYEMIECPDRQKEIELMVKNFRVE